MTAEALAAAGDAAMTADLEDIGKTLRASLGIPDPTDEERARREVRWNARRTGETCGQCGSTLEPKEALWRTRVDGGRSMFGGWSWVVVPLCGECKSDWRSYSVPRPCEACGRPVAKEVTVGDRDYRRRDERDRAKFYNLKRGLPPPKERMAHWFCSERCAKRCYRAKDRERRAEQRLKECPVCGGTFEAARSDAKTCSPACRQKAYRRRASVASRIRNAWDVGAAGAALVNVTGDGGSAAPGRAP